MLSIMLGLHHDEHYSPSLEHGTDVVCLLFSSVWSLFGLVVFPRSALINKFSINAEASEANVK